MTWDGKPACDFCHFEGRVRNYRKPTVGLDKDQCCQDHPDHKGPTSCEWCWAQLCDLCGATPAGNAHLYPRNNNGDHQVLKTVCYVGNTILKAIGTDEDTEKALQAMLDRVFKAEPEMQPGGRGPEKWGNP